MSSFDDKYHQINQNAQERIDQLLKAQMEASLKMTQLSSKREGSPRPRRPVQHQGAPMADLPTILFDQLSLTEQLRRQLISKLRQPGENSEQPGEKEEVVRKAEDE